MSKDELHKVADESTPEHVTVPETWGGLVVWAVGKWGAGAIFLCLLIPVYMDLKASNERFAEIASANARAIDAIAHKIEISNQNSIRLEDAIRRLELTSNHKD